MKGCGEAAADAEDAELKKTLLWIEAGGCKTSGGDMVTAAE